MSARYFVRYREIAWKVISGKCNINWYDVGCVIIADAFKVTFKPEWSLICYRDEHADMVDAAAISFNGKHQDRFKMITSTQKAQKVVWSKKKKHHLEINGLRIIGERLFIYKSWQIQKAWLNGIKLLFFRLLPNRWRYNFLTSCLPVFSAS